MNVAGDHEPDYRFTFANERTFLAWIRTALALDAAGIAAAYLLPAELSPGAAKAVGLALVLFGTLLAAGSVRQWAANQRALRQDAPLPKSRLPWLVGLSTTVISIAGLGLLLFAAIGGRTL